LNQVKWDEIITDNSDINIMYSNVISKITKILKQCIPTKTIRIKKEYYITKDLRLLLNKKRKAFKRFRNTQNFSDFCKYFDIFKQVGLKIESKVCFISFVT
jgi:hypothetical protein